MKNKIIKYFIFAITVFVFSIDNVFCFYVPHTVDRLVENSAKLNILEVNSNDKFIAYKILDTKYNNTSNTISYTFTDDFKSFLTSSTAYSNLSISDYMELTSGDITSGSTITSSTLDKLASLYATYIKNNSVTGTDMTTTGNTASATLMAGTYLVLPKTTSKIYAVMVGNLQMESAGVNNEWALNDTSIVAKVSDVSIEKLVNDSSTTMPVETFNSFTYTINVGVPKYPSNAVNKIFKITDVAPNEITFLKDDASFLEVYDGYTKLNLADSSSSAYEYDYTNDAGEIVLQVHIEEGKIEISVNTEFVATSTLKFVYKAKLQQSVDIGPVYQNNATLEYSNDPYGTGTKKIESSVGVYSSCLSFVLYDKDDHTKILTGGKFDIYDPYYDSVIDTIVTDNTYVTSSAGFVGRQYYLKQVSAPAGYKLINGKIDFDLSQYELGNEYNNCYLVKLEAEKANSLPFTGGSGTIIYSIFGLTIVATGITGYVLYKKKNKK